MPLLKNREAREIFDLLKSYQEQIENAKKGWADEQQKKYYGKELLPIDTSTPDYIYNVDEYIDLLYSSLREIRSLVGSKFIYSGTPNERGDRVGGKSSIIDNINIIFNSYLKNNSNNEQ